MCGAKPHIVCSRRHSRRVLKNCIIEKGPYIYALSDGTHVGKKLERIKKQRRNIRRRKSQGDRATYSR